MVRDVLSPVKWGGGRPAVRHGRSSYRPADPAKYVNLIGYLLLAFVRSRHSDSRNTPHFYGET
jgi:hypothetical protein